MKSILLIALTVFQFYNYTKAQITFQKVYGGLKTDILRNSKQTNDGGFVGVGYTVSTGAGYADLYLVKTNSSGDITWEKTYGSAANDLGYTVKILDDQGYFISGFTGQNGTEDAYLLRTDTQGNILWSLINGGDGVDRAEDGIPTMDGGYAIVGYTSSSPAKYFDAFLLKLNSNGEVIWKKTYGGDGYDNANCIRQLADGGYIIAGQTYSTGQGEGDYYIIRVNGTGDVLWEKTFGGPYIEEAQNILLTNDGNIIIAGDTESYGGGESDGYLVKLDLDGNLIWQKFYGATRKDVLKTVEQTSDGGLILSGVTRSFGNFEPDMWLIKTNGDGDTAWTKRFGGPYHDHGYTAYQTSDGGYLLSGHIEKTNSDEDFALIKLNETGNLILSIGYALNLNNDLLINLFPNPSMGFVNIIFDNTTVPHYLKIYNQPGQLLLEEKITMEEALNGKTLDLTSFEKGIYYVKIIGDKRMFTRRLVLL